jgi:hypothetical protein
VKLRPETQSLTSYFMMNQYFLRFRY